MACIPPHKRRESTHQKTKYKVYNPYYGSKCINRWFPAGPVARPVPFDQLSLQPFPCESMERIHGNKPMIILPIPVLALKLCPDDASEEPPWVYIAKRIFPDLIQASKNASYYKSMPQFENVVSDDARFRKTFHTSVPKDYLEELERLLPEIGFTFSSEKDKYQILVSDEHMPKIVTWCTCKILSDGTLEPYKIVSTLLRYLVYDISCLWKDFDLRLALKTTESLNLLDVKKKDEILKLISSAVLDPNVKGGLRWSFGRKSGRYECIKVWHLKERKFRGPSGSMQLKNGDGFDYEASYSELVNEVTLKMTEVPKLLTDDDTKNSDTLFMMVQDVVKLFWNHILNINSSLV